MRLGAEEKIPCTEEAFVHSNFAVRGLTKHGEKDDDSEKSGKWPGSTTSDCARYVAQVPEVYHSPRRIRQPVVSSEERELGEDDDDDDDGATTCTAR